MNVLYRVDRRLYSKGDIIEPQTDFEDSLKEEKLKMEKLLDKKRPDGIPERNKCLFLFQDLQGALRFFSKYGGNIYGVIPHSPIYHRGDMNKLDNIFDLFKFIEEDKDGILEAATSEYWKEGTHTFCPCYEILVNSATVVDVLCGNDKLSQFKDEVYEKGTIEKTSLYKELIQII